LQEGNVDVYCRDTSCLYYTLLRRTNCGVYWVYNKYRRASHFVINSVVVIITITVLVDYISVLNSETYYYLEGFILGTQAIHNIYVYIILYVMNNLGTEDGKDCVDYIKKR